MIIFLSGWGFQSSIWEDITSEFSEACHCEAAGRGNPAFAGSPRLRLAMTEYNDQLPNDSILVGWSLGGMIAANLCRLFPGKFRKLITVTCNPKFVATHDWPGVEEKNFTQFYQQAEKDLPSLLKEFQRLAIGNNRDPEIRKILQTHIHDAEQKELLLSHLDLLMQLDTRETYSEINIPTLHLFGDEDVLVPANCATRIKENYPHHTTHVIQGAGHIPFLTHKDEFMQQLRGFIHE